MSQSHHMRAAGRLLLTMLADNETSVCLAQRQPMYTYSRTTHPAQPSRLKCAHLHDIIGQGREHDIIAHTGPVWPAIAHTCLSLHTHACHCTHVPVIARMHLSLHTRACHCTHVPPV